MDGLYEANDPLKKIESLELSVREQQGHHPQQSLSVIGWRYGLQTLRRHLRGSMVDGRPEFETSVRISERTGQHVSRIYATSPGEDRVFGIRRC